MHAVLATNTVQPANGVLAALGPRQRAQIIAACERIDLEPDTEIMRAGQPIQHVVFLESGAAALIDAGESLRGVDLALIGPENMVGIPAALGHAVPDHAAIMRVRGHGYRLPRSAFERALERVEGLREICLDRADALLSQALQTAGCNAQHRLVPRLARWILAVADRSGLDELAITHERLAVALGVRRAGVTMALHELEGQRLIRSTRCRLTIRDRARLIESACSCYRPPGPVGAAEMGFRCH